MEIGKRERLVLYVVSVYAMLLGGISFGFDLLGYKPEWEIVGSRYAYYKEYCAAENYLNVCTAFNSLVWLLLPFLFFLSCCWIRKSVKDGLLAKNDVTISDRIRIFVISHIFLLSVLFGVAGMILGGDVSFWHKKGVIVIMAYGVVRCGGVSLVLSGAYLSMRKAVTGKM